MLARLAGNAALKADWQAALAAGRLPHALLLVGEAGSGAGFAARCLAADYLYPAGGPHAEAVLKGTDTECITLHGEGASGQIPVARVRAAREAIGRSALGTDARGRVLFLYGAQDLNGPSANALLKILEEPPADVLFLLTARSAAAVLPTVRSRCAAYTLAPVPLDECAAALCHADPLLGADRARSLAFLYGGLLGAALRAVREPAVKNAVQRAKDIATAAGRRDVYRVQALLAATEKDREGAKLLLDQLDCLCGAALRRPGLAGLDPARAAIMLQASEQARQALGRNGNLRLALSVAGAQICR